MINAQTVFSDGRPSSLAAVEYVKAMAAQKGANAIINLESRQTPTGKWMASGDAVVVHLLAAPDSRREAGGGAPPAPPSGT